MPLPSLDLRLPKFAVFIAAALVALVAVDQASAAKTNSVAKAAKGGSKKRSGNDDIFDNKHVLPLKIEIAENEWKTLQRDNRHFVRATVREGSNVWKEVGVHLKGAAGSMRGLEDRPALTLSFSKFTPDQKFHGLRKIHLNNSVQDGSYMTENLCGELFRKAGVPAARVSYATLELNGKSKGLYVLKEGFAKEMLSLYFKNTKGNLYDGGFLREITEPLERDSGEGTDVNDWADLKALAKAAQEPDPSKRFEALSKVLDIDRFISFAVLESITWDWDGYVMNHNNYRVYHDLDTGRMIFFPHGMDQMFWDPNGPRMFSEDKLQGIVARAVLKTPQGNELYYRRFGEVFTNVFQLEVVTNRVAQLAALVRGALTNLNGPNAGRDYDGQSTRIRDLVAARHASLQKQLSMPLPKPLAFTSGVARVTGWSLPENISDQGNAKRDQPVVDSHRTLHIQTSAPTTASWRTIVLLDAGRYRFEAMAKSAGIVPVADPKKGEGAGIRIHDSQTPRPNKLVGDAGWQKLSYEFDHGGFEVQLVCELRASKGEVWFDADSLQLVKIK